MSQYAGLVKDLRETAKHLDGISRFPYDDDPAKRIYSKKMADAAAAIEALQAQLPKRGEWIEDRTEIVCSKCHARFSDEIIFMNQNIEGEALKYCPNCGAKMEVQDG